MQTIPITTITFNQPFDAGQMRKFRGAIIESVLKHQAVFDAAGISTRYFHNHHTDPAIDNDPTLPEGAKRHYHYPYVQYQLRHRRAGIMGIGPGAQAVQMWLSVVGDTLTVGGRPFSLEVYQHAHRQWQPEVGETLQTYRINRWQPFSTENLRQWKDRPKLADRVTILDKLLWGHHFHLADGLGFAIDKSRFQLYVSTIDHLTTADSYGIKKLTLDITFATNLNLPGEIGLGQSTTIGFGKVQTIRKRQN
ncbi:MAG: CRISPR-associated endonuclease Cas6, partial [Cyclobacteriaceae bacterium]